MAFHSILGTKTKGTQAHALTEMPDYFRDLNLDQVALAIFPAEQNSLGQVFFRLLQTKSDILYRQQVSRDLERRKIFDTTKTLVKALDKVRLILTTRTELSYYPRARERQLLKAIRVYVDAVIRFKNELGECSPQSEGLVAFLDYIKHYVALSSFATMSDQLVRLEAQLASVRYSILIRDGSVTIRASQGEQNQSAAVVQLFEKFGDRGSTSRRLQIRTHDGMNHIQGQIQDRVALLYPELFAAVSEFCQSHEDFIDQTISVFTAEIQFFLRYLSYIEPLRSAGLSFCLPQVSEGTGGHFEACEVFDLVLARKLVAEQQTVVLNGVFLTFPERIVVVTGPNQGGKTTFARMIGQLHHLACLGLPVPGTQVHLDLVDDIFTHFERQETVTMARGKLQDDLVRVRTIVKHATSQSVVILNEIFASTALEDARYLANEIMHLLCEVDVRAIWVTFLDELASSNEKTVSMVASAGQRFTIERRPANGLAYAQAIAETHRLTYRSLRERLG